VDFLPSTSSEKKQNNKGSADYWIVKLDGRIFNLIKRLEEEALIIYFLFNKPVIAGIFLGNLSNL